MKLLIAEDNECMRRTIKSIVGEIATQIYECADGDEAITLYCRHRPDWVLMDIEMGMVDGIEATSRIKALFLEAKIVIVTNYDDSKLKEAAYQAGAFHYLLKKDLLDISDIITSGEDK
jgi:CheY-like chemotaxis protein